MNMVIFWLITLVILVVIELATMGLTTIWFAGGSLVSVFVAMAGGKPWLQIVIFLLVSGILLIFTRPIAVRYFNRERVKTNSESLIGEQAVVTSEINNLLGTGAASVGGIEWTARALGDEIIPKDAVVIVEEIQGVKLIVKKSEE